MEMYSRENSATIEKEFQDDPEARRVLKEAFNNTARWQEDFQGFSAQLRVQLNGSASEGTVVVRNPHDVTVVLSNENLTKWVQNQLAMIAAHRMPRNFEESDGKYALTLGEEDGHPLGRALYIHGDGFQSYYRVSAGRLTQINRTMPKMAFTINVEESSSTAEGKFLTTKYTVYYRSLDGTELKNTESITDTHVRVGGSDLPATRRMITFENGKVGVNHFWLEDHKLIEKPTESPEELNGTKAT